MPAARGEAGACETAAWPEYCNERVRPDFAKLADVMMMAEEKLLTPECHSPAGDAHEPEGAPVGKGTSPLHLPCQIGLPRRAVCRCNRAPRSLAGWGRMSLV